MSLVHEKLYQSHQLSKINTFEYVHDLVNWIMDSYTVSTQQISVTIDIDKKTSLLFDITIPCGLVINELLTNSIKYAFPDNRHGEIFIKLINNNSGHMKLSFTDNGVGLPDDIDLRKEESLGITLIYAIVEDQMNGKVEFSKINGLHCTIEFPDAFYHQRV